MPEELLVPDYGHRLTYDTQVCELCGREAADIVDDKKPKVCSRAIEVALLDRLRGHRYATVDDLFDALPADEVRWMIAGLGRKAIRIEQAVRAKKKPRAVTPGAEV